MNTSILIVDDDDLFQKMLHKAFTVYGFDVLLMMNGHIDFKVLEKTAPALAIVEVILNNPVGAQLIKKLQALLPDMRIIALVGMKPDGRATSAVIELKEVRELGVDVVLRKPGLMEDIKRSIGELLPNVCLRG